MFRIPTMTRLRSTVLGVTLGLLGSLAPFAVLGAEAHRDPKAVAVVDATLETIAPEDGWSKVGGVRFTFSFVKDAKAVSVTRYVWDVRSGLCRVEWKEDNGYEHIAVFNVGGKGRVGHSYMRLTNREEEPAQAGTASTTTAQPRPRKIAARWIEAPALMARKTLAGTYERFLHDSYWLLMPLRLKDPGVGLAYEGEKKIDTQTYDVVKVTYDQRIPGVEETTWIYVNRETHLIDRCESIRPQAPPETVLEGSNVKGTAKPEHARAADKELWIWKEWKPLGPVKLATLKSLEDGSASVELQGVETMTTVAESEFRSPVVPLPRPAPKPKNG